MDTGGIVEEHLVDRFSSYGNTIVAVSFVNVLAFLIAILDQDVRCSLNDRRGTVVLFSIGLQCAYFVAIMAFRKAELTLRHSKGETISQPAITYFARLHIARLTFVTIVTIMFSFIAWHGFARSYMLDIEN